MTERAGDEVAEAVGIRRSQQNFGSGATGPLVAIPRFEVPRARNGTDPPAALRVPPTTVGGRLLTVAFVDVERSTELLTEWGDVEAVTVIDAVVDAVRGQVPLYGGRSVKSLGDGLMIVFPAPRQAVSFAVAAQRALEGGLLRVRIGVNTGEVIDERDDPVGEAVNAAARIAAKATGGQTLVSDVVRQLVGSMPGIRFVDRGRKRLKGFPERWRVFEPRASASHRVVRSRSMGAWRWRT